MPPNIEAMLKCLRKLYGPSTKTGPMSTDLQTRSLTCHIQFGKPYTRSLFRAVNHLCVDLRVCRTMHVISVGDSTVEHLAAKEAELSFVNHTFGGYFADRRHFMNHHHIELIFNLMQVAPVGFCSRFVTQRLSAHLRCCGVALRTSTRLQPLAVLPRC